MGLLKPPVFIQRDLVHLSQWVIVPWDDRCCQTKQICLDQEILIQYRILGSNFYNIRLCLYLRFIIQIIPDKKDTFFSSLLIQKFPLTIGTDVSIKDNDLAL